MCYLLNCKITIARATGINRTMTKHHCKCAPELIKVKYTHLPWWQLFTTVVSVCWAMTSICFRRKEEHWLTQWVLLVLVSTPLHRTEEYVCRGYRSVSVYYTTQHNLSWSLQGSLLYVFKKRQGYILIKIGIPSCLYKRFTILPIFQGATQKCSL